MLKYITKQELLNAGGKVWHNRIYMNQQAIRTLIKYDDFTIDRAKVWFDCDSKELIADKWGICAELNHYGLHCKQQYKRKYK